MGSSCTLQNCSPSSASITKACYGFTRVVNCGRVRAWDEEATTSLSLLLLYLFCDHEDTSAPSVFRHSSSSEHPHHVPIGGTTSRERSVPPATYHHHDLMVRVGIDGTRHPSRVSFYCYCTKQPFHRRLLVPASMFTLRTRLLTRTTPSLIRPFSTTPSHHAIADAGPTPGNQPPGAKQAGRTTHPASDPQSNASAKDPAENNSGDDHPAKQPDHQAPSERSTGFNEGPEAAEGVKGGKEGLDKRTDR